MLRETHDINSNSGIVDLSAANHYSVKILIAFVDKNISGFRQYYLDKKDSDRENRISDFLVYYFNSCLLEEKDGFPPYNFGKNPTQKETAKETDIGVVVLSKSTAPVTIIEFEAKRLSNSSTHGEYVYGTRGGIERFKREHHGEHLTICGMFGYVQNETANVWIDKINGWIKKMADENKDKTINWKYPDEKLEKLDGHKYKSLNSRPTKSHLTLYHYFIDLVPSAN